MAPNAFSILLAMRLTSSAVAVRKGAADVFSDDDRASALTSGKANTTGSAMGRLAREGCTWRVCQKGALLRFVGKSESPNACWEETLAKNYVFEGLADTRHGPYIVVNPQPCATEDECKNGDGNDYWTNGEAAFNDCYGFAGYEFKQDAGSLPTCTPGRSAAGKEIGCATAAGCHWKKCVKGDQTRYVGLPEGTGSTCSQQGIALKYQTNTHPEVNRDGPVIVVNPDTCVGACKRGNGNDFFVNDINAYKTCYKFAGYAEIQSHTTLPACEGAHCAQ